MRWVELESQHPMPEQRVYFHLPGETKSLSVMEFLRLVSSHIETDNRKDGVELVLRPNHAFRCLKCGKVWTLRFDAVRCCK